MARVPIEPQATTHIRAIEMGAMNRLIDKASILLTAMLRRSGSVGVHASALTGCRAS